MSLPERFVGRPIAVFVAALAIAVFGILGAQRLPIDLLPDLSYPSLTIQTEYRDAAPLSVEQFITRPVEEAVGVVPGVRDMRSTSRAGSSEVTLEFDWDEPMEFAAMEVRERLGLVDLPREAERPRVLRFDPSLDPVMRVAFFGERPLGELWQIAFRWLKPRLEAVEGVAAAKVRGGLEPEILVEADEDRLATLGLTLDDLATALRAENVNRPGGTLRDFGAVYLIRTFHEFDDLDQLRRTPVRETPAGRVRVEDVAEVRRGFKDREIVARSQGDEIVEIALHREGSANTLQVAQAVREQLAVLDGELADDLSLAVLTDQSLYIADAIGQVWSAAWIGGLLAIAVLYFFLADLRATAIIALTIPVSVLGTFIPMMWFGVGLNIMSLGGLALGVGMLVDNSIVVLEAIDRRRKQGLTRPAAAGQGAGEVAGAVTAATLTTVCVFFPIVFVKGIAGQLFFDLAVTVCFSLVASLLASLTLIPSMAGLSLRGAGARTLLEWDRDPEIAGDARPLWRRAWEFFLHGTGPGGRARWLTNHSLLLPVRLILAALAPLLAVLQRIADALFPLLGWPAPLGNPAHPSARLFHVWLWPLLAAGRMLAYGLLGSAWAVTRGFDLLAWPLRRLVDRLQQLYPSAVRGALRGRWGVVTTAVGLLVLALYGALFLGTRLVPDLAQGEFAFRLALPEGTPLATTAQVVERIEAPLADDPRFARVFSIVGSLPSAASGRHQRGENLAQLNFVLPEGATAASESAAVARVREVLEQFPTADAELVHPSVLTLEPPVAVRVFSDDLDALDQGAATVMNALRELPFLDDLATTVEPGSPEIRVEIDREKAAAVGVTADQLSRSLQRQIQGELVGRYREDEDRLDIRLRAAETFRSRASRVDDLRVRLADGTAVPISTLAEVVVDRGPAAIHRVRSRMAELTARVSAADLGTALAGVRDTLAGLDLPPAVTAELAGQDEELKVSFDSLRLALALAVFLVYVVMAMQFESLVHPFVILLAVPMGLIGVVTALFLTATPLSVLVFIGCVMLCGIVVNNAIVLVDAVNRRRRAEGQALEAAIVDAGRERLRPILMTTATTILALTPMAMGLGAGDELRAPLAVTVIGGLLCATVLTLVVTPCLYRILSGGIWRATPARDSSGELATEAVRGGEA